VIAASDAAILSLRPRMQREEAIRRLQAGRLPRLLGARALRSVGQAFVPFYLYRVELSDRGRRWGSYFALDAVSGTLDPYEFERPPERDELSEVETRNRPLPALPGPAAETALRDKLRRLRYQAGFFRVSEPSFAFERVPLDLHVPYWLGFYGHGEAATLRVLDAVRRRFEGARARALFEDWLAA
jgi:hypothetical protein